ncbi:MAG: asparagine synthase (glutamine-hydrolyzing) [Chthoniobacterales bacterium]
MCAINGIVDLRGRSVEERVEDDALLRAMNAATVHRGPDGSGSWSDTFATLGSNRLAILDLSASANMPMRSASGRYTIVFNGEIYNFKDLKRALAGYDFKTQGDTEVILAGFERWGVEVFKKLRGMFALAVWDAQLHTLTLARDQSGIKPLYYMRTRGRIAFSSELKGLLADRSIERRIEPMALDAYLRLRYVPGPLTMLRGIEKLPAGSYAVMHGETFDITRYFDVPLQPLVHESRGVMEGTIQTLIDRAVASELVSDRKVGLFLSGGLDSTIVFDAATKAAGKMETFSLRFDVSEDEQASKFNMDADLAAQTAKQYGSNHHEVCLSEEEFVRLLPDAVHALDQPIANATAVAQMYLAREARKHIVVALAGDGGDELFGGYPRYGISRAMDVYQRAPGFLRAALSGVSSSAKKLSIPPGIERTEQFLFEKDVTLARAVSQEYISTMPALAFEKEYLANRHEADFTQLFMDADRRSWLVDEALARTDAMTMASSLEARVPLLNTELVLYASRLPSRERVGFREGKKILRSAFKSRLPAHVLSAKKSGFFSPTAKWLRRPAMQALAREVLSPGYHPATDRVLNFAGVEQMLEAHVGKRAYSMNTLWLLITLRLWAKTYNVTF